jgi:hypothetical protein
MVIGINSNKSIEPSIAAKEVPAREHCWDDVL